ASTLQGLLWADLKGHERHVRDEQTALDAAGYAACVVNHFVQRHGERVLMALHHHAERVTNEYAVYSGRIEQTCHRVVVSRQHGKPHAARFGRQEIRDGHGPTLAVVRVSSARLAFG